MKSRSRVSDKDPIDRKRRPTFWQLLESLESRVLLDGYPTNGITVKEMRKAYGMDNVLAGGLNGAGQTIAIVFPGDVHDSIFNDLAQFDAAAREDGAVLPDLRKWNDPGTGPYLRVLDQYGKTTYPDPSSDGKGESEVAMDVEWAHAMARQRILSFLRPILMDPSTIG